MKPDCRVAIAVKKPFFPSLANGVSRPAGGEDGG